jgi:hypothetical protein
MRWPLPNPPEPNRLWDKAVALTGFDLGIARHAGVEQGNCVAQCLLLAHDKGFDIERLVQGGVVFLWGGDSGRLSGRRGQRLEFRRRRQRAVGRRGRGRGQR